MNSTDIELRSKKIKIYQVFNTKGTLFTTNLLIIDSPPNCKYPQERAKNIRYGSNLKPKSNPIISARYKLFLMYSRILKPSPNFPKTPKRLSFLYEGPN